MGFWTTVVQHGASDWIFDEELCLASESLVYNCAWNRRPAGVYNIDAEGGWNAMRVPTIEGQALVWVFNVYIFFEKGAEERGELDAVEFHLQQYSASCWTDGSGQRDGKTHVRIRSPGWEVGAKRTRNWCRGLGLRWTCGWRGWLHLCSWSEWFSKWWVFWRVRHAICSQVIYVSMKLSTATLTTRDLRTGFVLLSGN